MEDTVKFAKETIHSSKAATTPTPILKLNQKKASPGQKGTKKYPIPFPKGTCLCCGKIDHSVKDCWFINSKCRICQKKGHIEVDCLQKKKGKELIAYVIE